MADVLVADVASGSQFQQATASYEIQVAISDTVIYCFMLDSTTTTRRFVYRKSTDGGQTWGSPVDIDSSNRQALKFSIWYDRWTKGDSGDLIHLAWIEDQPDDVWYRALDTDGDTLGTQAQVFAGSSADAGAQLSFNSIAAGKTPSGRLWCAGRIDNDGENFTYYSEDGGGTWSAFGQQALLTNTSTVHFLGGDYADGDDAVFLHLDRSSGEVRMRFADASAGTFVSGNVIHTIAPDDIVHSMSAVHYWADDEFLLAVCESHSGGSADIATYVVDAQAGTTTRTADILTNTDFSGNITLYVDQNDGKVFAGYTSGGTVGSVIAVYKSSTDKMTSWSSETAYGETTDELWGIFGGYCRPLGVAGVWQPIFYNNDLFDVLLNYGNRVALTGAPPSAGAAAAVLYYYREFAS